MKLLWTAPLLLVVAGCSTGSAGPVGQASLPAGAASRVRGDTLHVARWVKFKHIVVIIQENRSVDDLFNGFCIAGSLCANTVSVDPVSGTPLKPVSLADPSSPDHSHNDFIKEYDGGAMDGFTKAKIANCGNPPCTAIAYVPSSETQIYRQLATVDGVLSDMTFETLQGPSLPAHFYAISGQSGGYDDDHWAIEGGSGNCATQDANAEQILMTSGYPGQQGNAVVPCKDFPTIFDLLASAGHTWKYYAHSTAGFLEAPQNIQHLYGSPNFIVPETQVLTDISKGQLADVSFVTPSGANSDHPTWVSDPLAGPEWVGSIVNAIGETPYWNDTAVVVWWDDWGGFFDHVAPSSGQGPSWIGNPNPFEYGFRVPLMFISAYANVGTIDHRPRTFVSALRLIEQTFNLPSLGTTDQYEPDGLNSMFDLNRKPIPFTAVGGSRAQPFRHLKQ